MRYLILFVFGISFIATSCAPKVGNSTSTASQSSGNNTTGTSGNSIKSDNNIFNDTEPGKIIREK